MSRPKAFTLLEAVLAAAILAIGVVAVISMVSRGLLLSDVNKQVKVAVMDIKGVIEEIQGIPFDQIMDPDYPTSEQPVPRFRHQQPVPTVRLAGLKSEYAALNPVYDPETDTYRDPATSGVIAVRDNATGEYVNPLNNELIANAPHLDNEVVTVTYGSRLDSADADLDGDTTEVLPLTLATGAATSPVFKPTGTNPVERFRPANNSPALDEFRTPEPLYITVEVTWTGPRGNTMRQKVNFVRSR